MAAHPSPSASASAVPLSPGASAPADEIRAVLRAHRSVLRSVGAFSAVINILMLAPAIYMLQVYDRVLASANPYTLLMLSLIVLGLYLLMGVLEWVRSLVVIRIGEQMDADLHARVYDANFQVNLKGGQGLASQTLNDLTTLRQFVTGQALFAFFDAPWFPVYLLVIFLFHPWLGVTALAGAVALVLLAYVNERWSRAPMADASRFQIQANQMATAQLQNAASIQAMGMLARLRSRWQRLHAQFVDHQGVASERAALVTAVTKTVRLTLQSAMLGIGAWLAIQGSITAGMMIAGSILVGRMLAPIEQLIGAWRQWGNVRLAHERLLALLRASPVAPARLPLPRPAATLQVEGASLMPPGGTVPTLVNIRLALQGGQALAVVGPSASGKSSLARLLTGVWQPRVGTVRLDGADIQQWDRDALGDAIGYLPQEIELFAGTVAENIARFGDVQADKVIQAAQLAGVHDLVLRLPQGYDTELGAGGAGLSGGQKQRIALARALYGDPVLVVLDEPDAHLDRQGEAALAQAVTALKQSGAMVLLITHRPALLSVADLVLAMQAGQMARFGPARDVLAAFNGQASEAGGKPDASQAPASAYRLAGVQY